MHGFFDEMPQDLHKICKGGYLLKEQLGDTEEFGLALSGFEAWISLVDDVQPSFAAHDLAVSVAVF